MNRADFSKVDHICATSNRSLGVDLYLNKQSGMFFAKVGEKQIEKSTKAEVVKLVIETLNQISDVAWRQVIVIRVDNRHNGNSEENNGIVQSASCSFTYYRRERAHNPLNPLKKREIIEREHPIDFEERVAEARKNSMTFTRGVRLNRKRAADQVETELRADRAALRGAGATWDREFFDEYELPYTEEAWAGIDRIAKTLESVQARLDAFAKTATAASLAALGTGSSLFQLSPHEEEPK